MMTTLDSNTPGSRLAEAPEQDPGRLAAMRAGYLDAYERGQQLILGRVLPS